MKKQTIFTIFAVVLLGLAFSVYQYLETFKTEIASATSTVPNPGHLWSSMECNSDTLCVDMTNKRLGIGTTVPALKAHVVGTTGNPAISGISQNGGLRITGSGSQVMDFGVNNGTGLGWLQSTVASDLSLNYALALNPNGGNVGIGTTTPGAKLDLFTANASLPTTAITTGAQMAGLRIGDPGSGLNNTKVGVWGNLGTLQSGMVFGRQATGWGTFVAFHTHAAATTGVDNLIERMRIDSEGNVGIGTTSPSYTLTVAGTAWVTSGSWSGSDIRWKKNVSTLSTTSSLDKILKLNPVTYEWKTDEFPEMKFSKGAQLGFIAQDVENIIPEVVTTDNNGYKGISYEKIVPVLTGAIQEQQKEIEQLKTMVCLDHPLIELCK